MQHSERKQDVWCATVTFRNAQEKITGTATGLVDLPRAMAAHDAADHLTHFFCKEIESLKGLYCAGKPPHKIHADIWSHGETGQDHRRFHVASVTAYMHPPGTDNAWEEIVGGHEGTKFIEYDWQ